MLKINLDKMSTDGLIRILSADSPNPKVDDEIRKELLKRYLAGYNFDGISNMVKSIPTLDFITDEQEVLLLQIVKNNGGTLGKLKLIPRIEEAFFLSPEEAIVSHTDSDRWSNSGISEFICLSVISHGQKQTQRWMYRDGASQSGDRWDLRFHKFYLKDKQVTDKQIVYTVMMSREKQERTTTFTFDLSTFEPFSGTNIPELGKDEKQKAREDWQIAKEHLASESEDSWKRKPVRSMGGEQNIFYDKPILHSEVYLEDFGIGAIIAQEQIDHHPSFNRSYQEAQYRATLYLFNKGKMCSITSETSEYGKQPQLHIILLEPHALYYSKGSGGTREIEYKIE